MSDHTTQKMSEAEFMASYDINAFDRPSVTTDIAVFSMFDEQPDSHRKDAEPRLHVLLIQRGEHPFIDQWALPGGFLRSAETVEECALRELQEETNLVPASLLPIGVFSDPARDPRGRIVSNAFASVVRAEEVEIMGGSDAVKAQWFEVDFSRDAESIFRIDLHGRNEKICIVLREIECRYGNNKFEILTNTGLAFDHAKIIATALSVMRNEADQMHITFDFLPETFTLAALQKVQETLTGTPLLTANFRRKIADLVEETEQYTEGMGHRPARLFRHK